MLYEIISPDAFLRPFLDDYATLSAIYEVIRKAYTRRVYVDRAFQKKTNELVQNHIGAELRETEEPYLAIGKLTLEAIAEKASGNATKVINLIKAIEKKAEDESDDPFLVAMAERAQAVQDAFEQRQKTTEETLEELRALMERDRCRKVEQAAKGFDGLTFFVYRTLLDAKIGEPEAVSAKIKQAFIAYPNWLSSDNAMRELRTKVTLAIFSQCDDLEQVADIVERFFISLEKASKI